MHVHVDLNEDITPRNRFNTNSASMTTDCWKVNLDLHVCCLWLILRNIYDLAPCPALYQRHAILSPLSWKGVEIRLDNCKKTLQQLKTLQQSVFLTHWTQSCWTAQFQARSPSCCLWPSLMVVTTQACVPRIPPYESIAPSSCVAFRTLCQQNQPISINNIVIVIMYY